MACQQVVIVVQFLLLLFVLCLGDKTFLFVEHKVVMLTSVLLQQYLSLFLLLLFEHCKFLVETAFQFNHAVRVKQLAFEEVNVL